MFFTPRTNLFRSTLTKTGVVALALGCSAMNAVAGPTIKFAPSSHQSEAEEWGLDSPQQNPGSGTQEKDLVDQFFDALKESRQESRQQPGANPVAVELASAFEQSAVYIFVTMPNGDKYKVIGWIIDAEQGVVMTEFSLLAEAEALVVAFPNLPRGTDGSMAGSIAKLLPANSDLGVSYLKIVQMPQQPLISLSVGQTVTSQRPVDQPSNPQRNQRPAPNPPTPRGQQGNRGQQEPRGAQRPAQVNSPVCGQWNLQHQGPGGMLYIEAVFTQQGQFSMQVITVDNNGNRTHETQQGRFQVQGDNLVVQTNEGTEELPFWFEDGMLMVNFLKLDTTLCFRKA